MVEGVGRFIIIGGGQMFKCRMGVWVSRLTGDTGQKEASSRWPQDVVNSSERMATTAASRYDIGEICRLPSKCVRVRLLPHMIAAINRRKCRARWHKGWQSTGTI